jgi:hypothetical protein
MIGTAALRLEQQIARAHRAAWAAATVAELLPDQGYADDLHQICDELRRIQESLLKSARRPRASRS